MTRSFVRLILAFAALLGTAVTRATPPPGYDFTGFNIGLARAKAEGKPIFLYSDPELKKLYSEHYALVHVDAAGAWRLPAQRRAGHRGGTGHPPGGLRHAPVRVHDPRRQAGGQDSRLQDRGGFAGLRPLCVGPALREAGAPGILGSGKCACPREAGSAWGGSPRCFLAIKAPGQSEFRERTFGRGECFAPGIAALVQDSFGDAIAQWHPAAAGNARGELVVAWVERDGSGRSSLRYSLGRATPSP